MPSEISPMPNGISLLDKMWRFSAPLASVIVILYVVWQILITVNSQTQRVTPRDTSSLQAHLRDDFDTKILEIMQEQAKALTLISQTQGDMKRLLEDQQKSISTIAAEIRANKQK